ncbi:MAG: site-specific integrase, partial [Rhodoglobus sp.]|nr:site-specific integrase [Rhodoglobus sp.]
MRLFRRRDENDRPIGPWHAQWYDAEGKRHERSTRAYDKKAAEDIARQWERDAADPAYATARDTTLSHALERYFDELDELVTAGRRSKDTYDSYKKKAGHLVRIFEYEGETYVPFQLAKLSAVAVKGFISKRRGEQVKESTIHKELVVLRAVLQTAKIDGIWFGDIDAIVPPKFTPDYRPKTRFLTPEELIRLLQELPGDRAAVVAFIVAT